MAESVATPPPAEPAASRRYTGNSVWRARPLFNWLRRRSVYRAAATFVLVGLAGLFGWLVFRPLFHPNAQLQFLSGADYHVLRAPPATFALEDADALRPLAKVLYSPGGDSGLQLLGAMKDPAALRSLAATWADLTPDRSGVLMVYIDGHGVSDDGTAYLLCRNFDPANPAAGRLPLRDLLHQLSEAPVGVKLLILDAGRIPCDPRLGMLVNEFPRLLEQEVARTEDSRLWVLSSNAAFQRSHVSWSLERSVFSYFVTTGLSGAADLNKDHAIDLDELHRYVTANTAAWVRDATAGAEAQTPVLLWGGGRDFKPRDCPVLLPSAASVASARLQFPARTGAFKMPPGTVASPYVQQAQGEYAPELNRASKDATRKVPGSRTAKTTMRTRKKAKKRIARAELRTADRAGATNIATGASENGATAETNKATEKPGDAAAPPGGKKSGGEKTPADSAAAKPAKADAAATAATGSSANTAEKAQPAKPAEPPSAADLLADAWQLRDTLVTAPADGARPLDFAPQPWREFEAWLLGQERLYRSGGVSDPRDIATSLAKLLPRLARLPNVPVSDDSGAPDLAARIAELVPHIPADANVASSLAMAQFFAARSGATLPAEIKAAADTYDRLSRDGDSAELAAWLAKLKPRLDRYAEIRFARAIAALNLTDGAVVRLALEARRAAEEAAAVDPLVLPWIEKQVETADRIRLAGERMLLDSLGADRRELAASSLRQAIDLYDRAADDAAAVGDAVRLENDLLDRAPYYVASCCPAAVGPSRDAPTPADVAALLDRLAHLSAALDAPDPAHIEQLRSLTNELSSMADEAEAGWGDANVSQLTGRNAPAGRIGRLETLLATPLPTAEVRIQLLQALAAADEQLADSMPPVSVPQTLEPTPVPTAQQWQSTLHRAELEVALARLAAGPDTAGRQASGTLEQAGDSLRSAVARLEQASDAETVSAAWDAVKRFGVATRDFYRGLPPQLETVVQQTHDLSDSAARGTRILTLRTAARSVRLLDPRDGRQLGGANPCGVLAEAAWFDLLSWQSTRLEAALVDAPPADVEFLSAAAQTYRTQAAEIAQQPKLPAASGEPIDFQGPTSLSLTTQPEQTVDLKVRNISDQSAEVWLMLDYDPAQVDLEVPEVPPLRLQPQWLAEHAEAKDKPGDEASLESPRPDRAGAGPSLQLQAGQSQTLRLKVRARPAARGMSRLIFKAIGSGLYVRHQIDVALPPPDAIAIVVESAPGTWTESDSRYLLEPFPNRQTSYRLALSNRSLTDRKVDVEVLALDQAPLAAPPCTALSADDARAVLGRLGPARSLAVLTNIAVPSGAKSVPLPFPKPGAPAAAPAAPNGEKAAAAGTATDAAKSVEASPAPAAAVAPVMPADHGLVLVVSDQQTKLKTVLWLDVAPQRPRRYVHPEVGYNLDRGILEIRIRPQDKSLVPPDGVAVHAELSPKLPAGAQSELDGRVEAPDYEARLSAEIAPETGKTVTVRLTIDGYPRAFTYDVPCSVQSTDIAELSNLRAIRFLSPVADQAFKTPLESIPVKFEVDAPLGAFQNPDDVLEVGVDTNRDRDLREGPSVRLKADRQVHVGVASMGPGGLLELKATVEDFHMNIPAPSVRNAKVDVLGRLYVGGQTGWSAPVEIILDGAPPRIESVKLVPPLVSAGPDEEITVSATDDELSGVAKVEAGFDPLGTGQLGPLSPPKILQRDDSGHWVGKLPTKELSPGALMLLVRATDKLGNVGEYTKVKVHVLTPEEVKAAESGGPVHLLGMVFVGPDQAPGAKLTLTTDKGAVFATATANGSGEFSVAEVPPGKYKLSVKALFHNKNRKKEEDVTIEPGSKTKSLRIVLK
jgi:hypothetical protein